MADKRFETHKTYTVNEARQKLEAYCAYQERCHDEVVSKLRSMSMIQEAIDHIIGHLIEHNFLNEERFSIAFARGKHRIKKWGKVRITNELKIRNISQRNISTALKEISLEEYQSTFHDTAEKHWESITGAITQAKRKKFCDFLLRKGFESNLVYDKLRELESGR
ncbi:regulatory protein RecX [Flavobacterium sp.]|uniref:regulatory protein RecX n=1 Tax=Flavobacterium sp. TaxID=239 RepID=UPI001226D156|nr:regulatory protein RecX [Flavobacterium sp.]RZJ73312.1 MAG: RecX family transcriptional regulator [Flavobacterium sp.]